MTKLASFFNRAIFACVTINMSVGTAMQSLSPVNIISFDSETPLYQPSDQERKDQLTHLATMTPIRITNAPGYTGGGHLTTASDNNMNSNNDLSSSNGAYNYQAQHLRNIDNIPQQQVVTTRQRKQQIPQSQYSSTLNSTPLSQIASSAGSDTSGTQETHNVVTTKQTTRVDASGNDAGVGVGQLVSQNNKRVPRRRKTAQQRLMDMSDPQNYGLRFCWRFLWPVPKGVYNWGWLVNFRECLQNQNSPFYQISNEKDVCTSDGGMEVINTAFDESATPYKVACIPRREALLSDTESCWSMTTKMPLLKLQRVPSIQADAVCGSNMPWPFHDGRHVSSRFGIDSGGIESLYQCNGGLYKSAVVMYKLNLNGDVNGFGKIHCVPKDDAAEPNMRYRCTSPGHHCLHYLDPVVVQG
eukprot:Lankesteria_metandrocarpae@DN4738_c0_g1_i2.p1